jgi:predicted membrane protein
MDLIFLQYLSIILEICIAVMGVLISLNRKKLYGWGIFLTFIIYVFYDFSKLADMNMSPGVLYSLFFIATVSMLLSVIGIYKNK